ncbi:hypothetical protein Dda_7083 [Drechslerella dactyloides]|uniref:Uncharacterized protein n=1 Tax=Drechslerella dactyloides TaxID=74499 RepID=A0AAD6IWT5_DREDA|nr:hypothetical protein Dda_7083 [Drechslerella dactyloides]
MPGMPKGLEYLADGTPTFNASKRPVDTINLRSLGYIISGTTRSEFQQGVHLQLKTQRFEKPLKCYAIAVDGNVSCRRVEISD